MTVEINKSYITFASHFDGANGAKTATDYCGNVLTFNGGAVISNAQYAVNGSSLYLPSASTSFVSAPNFAGAQFGTGDFTIRWRMYCLTDWSSMSNPGIAGQKYSDNNDGWQIYRNGSYSDLRIRIAGTADFASNATPTTRSWDLWEICRQAGVLYFFKNGQLTNTVACTANASGSAGAFYIGKTQTWGGYFNGFIQDLVIKKGIADHTASYTPPADTYVIANYTLAGTVLDGDANPISRTLAIYDRNSNKLVNSAVSDAATGAFLLYTETGGYHYAVALSDTEYENALIYDWLTPVAIAESY